MKTTQMLILTTFLVGIAACSKQENTEVTSQAPMAEMPAMEKPMEQKSTAMLPNEIDAKDMSGNNVEQDASGKKVIYQRLYHFYLVSTRYCVRGTITSFMCLKTPSNINFQSQKLS